MDLGIINAGLLLALVVPVIMRYRILPITGTPYWLFGIIFVLLVANVLLSVFAKNSKRIQSIIFWLVLVIVIGGVSMTAMIDRSKTAPVYGVHDIILQQEAAMRFLLVGKNPYKETYENTPLAAFHYEDPAGNKANPAIYHFVMPPWYLLFPFSFYFVSTPVLGFFDGRMVLLALLFALLFIIQKWFKNPSLGKTAILLTALSPAVIDYFVEGRSDLFALFWFVWALYLLDKRKMLLSVMVFALAMLAKQTIWFAAPFYAVYFIASIKEKKKRMLILFTAFIAFVVCVALLTVPFIAWDASAFFDSIVLYLSGNTKNAYPISGYGLSMMLWAGGVIKDIYSYYPFALWQAPLGLGVMGVTLIQLWKKPKMSSFLIFYGVTLFVVWYTSRYFNNSHVSYLSSIFVLGLLKYQDEQGEV